MLVAPVAYQVILEPAIIAGQFRNFESPRVHTRLNSLELFLVHRLTSRKARERELATLWRTVELLNPAPDEIWRQVSEGRMDYTCDHRLSRSWKVEVWEKNNRKNVFSSGGFKFSVWRRVRELLGRGAAIERLGVGRRDDRIAKGAEANRTKMLHERVPNNGKSFTLPIQYTTS